MPISNQCANSQVMVSQKLESPGQSFFFHVITRLDLVTLVTVKNFISCVTMVKTNLNQLHVDDFVAIQINDAIGTIFS